MSNFEDKIECPFCFGFKCDFTFSMRSYICICYTNNMRDISNICRKCEDYICPLCKGIGLIYWIDRLFNDHNNDYKSNKLHKKFMKMKEKYCVIK